MKIQVRRKATDSYQHGDLREALIQAGLKLLTEGGVGALSLRAAAHLAGVSHAAPYRHFPDKDALVAAIAEEGFRRLTSAMRDEVADTLNRAAATTTTAPRSPTGRKGQARKSAPSETPTAPLSLPPFEHLRALGIGYVNFAVNHPAYLRVIFGGVAGGAVKTSGLTTAGDEAYGTLRDAVAAAAAAGALRPDDVDTLSLSCWTTVHGFSMLLVDNALPPPLSKVDAAREMVGHLMQLLFDGIREPTART